VALRIIVPRGWEQAYGYYWPHDAPLQQEVRSHKVSNGKGLRFEVLTFHDFSILEVVVFHFCSHDGIEFEVAYTLDQVRKIREDAGGFYVLPPFESYEDPGNL